MFHKHHAIVTKIETIPAGYGFFREKVFIQTSEGYSTWFLDDYFPSQFQIGNELVGHYKVTADGADFIYRRAAESRFKARAEVWDAYNRGRLTFRRLRAILRYKLFRHMVS